MKVIVLCLLSTLLLLNTATAQNLWPLLQTPPVSLENPTSLPPEDFRSVVKTNATNLIKSGDNAAIAIELHNGATPYTLFAGYRNIEAQDPVTNTTIFRIASMSKIVTAISVLQYVEKNMLYLDEPISKYLPSFADATVIKPITPDVYTFAQMETVAGSPLIVVPLPYLNIVQIVKLHRQQTGIQLQGAIAGVKVTGIHTIMSFNPIAKTVAIALNCPPTVTGVFTVNGTLDVLPDLPRKWTPFDYVNIPSDPVNPLLTKRVYYSTEPSKPITIRHLLTNTAGYSYATPGYTQELTMIQTAIMTKRDSVLNHWPMTPTLDMDVVEWAERISKIPMQFQPGTGWSYGPQIRIAGAVLVALERAEPCSDENTKLYDIQKKNIFDPLNITDAGYFISNTDPNRVDKISRLSHTYTNIDTLFLGVPMVTTPYTSLFLATQDQLLPGLHSILMDGTNPSVEGDANPIHPIYGKVAPRKLEAGDSGLYMRHDEFQRILAMLSNNGTYNGVQLLTPATVTQMFKNQIGSLSIPPNVVIGGNAKWGFGVAVSDGTSNPHPLVQATAHWSGAFGGWFFVNMPSNTTAFTFNSNTFPGGFRDLAGYIVDATS